MTITEEMVKERARQKHREYMRAWRTENKEKVNSYQREWHRKFKERTGMSYNMACAMKRAREELMKEMEG